MKNLPENMEGTNQSQAESVSSRLAKLESEFSNWHDTSRPALYRMLAECMSLAKEIREVDAKKEELKKFLSDNGFKPDKRSTVYHMVLKAVVGDRRRRVSKYAKVLKKAEAEGVEPPDLPAWIVVGDGIDEIAYPSESSPSSSSDIDEVEIGRQLIKECHPLVTLPHIDNLSLPANEELVVLVCRVDAYDQIDILNFRPSESVLKKICKEAFKNPPDNTLEDFEGTDDEETNQQDDGFDSAPESKSTEEVPEDLEEECFA